MSVKAKVILIVIQLHIHEWLNGIQQLVISMNMTSLSLSKQLIRWQLQL